VAYGGHEETPTVGATPSPVESGVRDAAKSGIASIAICARITATRDYGKYEVRLGRASAESGAASGPPRSDAAAPRKRAQMRHDPVRSKQK
jgi:hypothetical protein